MMILKDNTPYFSTSDNLADFLALQELSNCKISELPDKHGNNLLIYPHSFSGCEDGIGKQHLLSSQVCFENGQCTKVSLLPGNIVGFIGWKGTSIAIHSRFTQDTDNDFFLHYLLQKVLNINIFNLQHGTNEEQIFDFLLYLFPKLLSDALAQGIYKEYQRNEYNDANIRGTINVPRHLKCNVPFKGNIAYHTREFSYDNHITELMRHTIEYIGKTKLGKTVLESNADTRANIAQIRSATPRYNHTERDKIIKSNLKAISHPFFTHYFPLQQLCLRILRHEKIKYGEKKNQIHGILFDISYLWEEYLATILKKHGFKHPNNRKGIGRICLAKQNKLYRYPDFYKEQNHIIADAKYKRDIDNRNDINQMITYMYRLKGALGICIHPTSEENSQEIKYFLLGHGLDTDAKLQTYPFTIPQTAIDYKSFIEQIQLSEKAFSKYLQNQ